MIDRCDRLTLETQDIQERMFHRSSLIEDVSNASRKLEEINLAVSNAESEAKNICREILQEAVRISDDKKAESYAELCQQLSSIVDMNVECEAGSVLLVEKKETSQQSNQDEIKDDDSYDYDVIWKSDQRSISRPLPNTISSPTQGKGISRKSMTISGNKSKRSSTSSTINLNSAKQRLFPISKSFSMMS